MSSWSSLVRGRGTHHLLFPHLNSFLHNQPLQFNNTYHTAAHYWRRLGTHNPNSKSKCQIGTLPIVSWVGNGIRRHYATSYNASKAEQKSRKTLFYLTGLVIAMVGSSYAAVPLYRRFCQATDYGGTVQRRESVEEKIARHSKEGTVATWEIVVQFNADVADGMPWKFIPTQREVRVKPGESALAFYTAENRSSAPITGVSTYNVTPMKLPSRGRLNNSDIADKLPVSLGLRVVNKGAAVYFNKIQCFCFEEQRLLPGEQIDMPVFFYIDPEFETDPRMEGINNIILSYTFFKVSDQ